jgi:hypothetical protein
MKESPGNRLREERSGDKPITATDHQRETRCSHTQAPIGISQAIHGYGDVELNSAL